MSEVVGIVGGAGAVLRVRFRRVHGRNVELRRGAPAAAVARDVTRRPAYVARLLALAHRLRRLLERREVSSIGELARRLGVSQPRVTQILNLTYLAPGIQAEVVNLEAVDGVEPMTERPLREVVGEAGWELQKKLWAARHAGSRRPGHKAPVPLSDAQLCSDRAAFKSPRRAPK